MKISYKLSDECKPTKTQLKPGKIFLFTGHMIDRPGRIPSRFPSKMEPKVALAIDKKLGELDAGAEDLALCGGACGGDLLFAEACLKRGLRLELRLPFEETAFIQESVVFAGTHWHKRFYRVKKNQRTKIFIMPKELGPLPKGVNPFEQNNLWQLKCALSWGIKELFFLCLWNLEGGDGPGGTKHMYDEVKKRSGRVHILDTNQLFKNL